MGHNLIPISPNTIPWNAVVESLYSGDGLEEVVAATASLAERQLRRGKEDPVYVEAVRLLALLPLAARNASFPAALRDLALEVSDAPGLAEIAFAAADRLDEIAAGRADRGDFGELARRALVGALTSRVGDELPGLLDVDATDVKTAVRRFSEPRTFATLARAFYTRLLSEVLTSLLDRVIASHVGPGARFDHAGERSRFDQALSTYAWETTRILHEFAAGWFGKNVYREEILTPKAVSAFAAVALQKTLAELQRKER